MRLLIAALLPLFVSAAEIPPIRGLSRTDLLQYRDSQGQLQTATKP